MNATEVNCTSSASSATSARYRQQCAALDMQIADLQLRDRYYSRARGGVFALIALASAGGIFAWGPPVVMWCLAALLFAGFVVLAGFHEAHRDRLSLTIVRKRLKQQQFARYRRQWDEVPIPEIPVPSAHDGLVRDLDLFGPASLFQWLCRAHTPRGKEILRDWLLDLPLPNLPYIGEGIDGMGGPNIGDRPEKENGNATEGEIARRQEAVKQLAVMSDLRDNFELHARVLAGSDNGPRAFVQWAESGARFTQRRWLMWTVRGLTLAMLILPALIWWQWLSVDWAVLVFALLVLHVLLNAFFVGGIHDVFNQVSAGQNELWHYSKLLAMIRDLPEDCSKLRELRAWLDHGDSRFETSLRSLNRIMKWGNGRRSGLFGIPYFFAEILWFLDFHVVTFLERWQQRHGHAVRGWFEAVGTFEALSCLAAVAADHPEWTFPCVATDRETLNAIEVGHPLLPVDRCQTNDIEIGPAGTFVLVTGSNMSGKSTLLRAIGVNIVLAQCGGPVRASRFEMPVVELATAMRVTDSLAQGVSYFLAELNRLKEVVDRATALTPSSVNNSARRRLLFLLDEILQGTNSAERHIAVTQILRCLMRQSALGAVSTHDLSLAAAPELQPYCRCSHFREQFIERDGVREMQFDYRLRPGISPTTNALILMKMVGLPVDGLNRDR